MDTAEDAAPVRALKPGEQYPLKDKALVLLAARPQDQIGAPATPVQVDTLRQQTRPVPYPGNHTLRPPRP